MTTRRPSDRKRKQDDLQPAFLDVTASVSASQFAGCRLPEIKHLFASASVVPLDVHDVQFPDPLQTLQSTGRKRSSRHLRRRVTCFQSRKRHRYPRLQDAQQHPNRVSINRHARRRHQLRHGHDSWRNGHGTSSLDTPDASTKVEGNAEFVAAEDTPATSSRPPPHWMTTHVWYAKRFRMATLFGWRVPMLHQNRGCAAARRLCLVDGKCLVQDVTWCAQPLCFQVSSHAARASILGRLGIEVHASDDGDNLEMEHLFGGDGIAHELDMAPLHALCPVQWICSSQALFQPALPPTAKEESTALSSALHLYLFCHPAARSSLFHCVSQAVEEEASEESRIGTLDGIPGGLICFQLRGSSDAIANVYKAACSRIFSQATTMTSVVDLAKLQQQQHGDILMQHHASSGTTSETIMLRRVCPRDPTVVANFGVCGWDIWCSATSSNDPAAAMPFFVALVLAGACPIGITEAAFLALEAEPPYPVFPRDFPDTEQGRQYWRAGDICANKNAEDKASGCDRDEWVFVRRHWEGGEGRIRLPETFPRLAQVDFSTLVGSGSSTTGDHHSVVVVRDAFAQPLRQALDICGRIMTSDGTHNRRRKRRSAGMNRCFVKEACPLSSEQYAAQQQFTKNLLEHLSLPAVVLVSIQLVGSGRLEPGATVAFHVDDDCSTVAGYVTAGFFSSTRGRFQGLGVVSARCFLEATLCARKRRCAMVAPTLLGSRQISLKMSVGDKQFGGVLSLL